MTTSLQASALCPLDEREVITRRRGFLFPSGRGFLPRSQFSPPSTLILGLQSFLISESDNMTEDS